MVRGFVGLPKAGNIVCIYTVYQTGWKNHDHVNLLIGSVNFPQSSNGMTGGIIGGGTGAAITIYGVTENKIVT